MASKKYLDETGLVALWEIIKTAVATKVDNTLVGQANGLATLDNNGQVPLSQLKNLDTTFAEVLPTLPTSDIKRHLYLIKSTTTTDENVYIEYLYIGELPIVTDTTASNYSTNKYDSTKWEKLGEYKAEINLSPYALKTQTIGDFTIGSSGSGGLEIIYHNLNKANGSANKLGSFTVPYADSSTAGVMSTSQAKKLSNIAENANNYTLPTASSSTLGGIKVGDSLSIEDGILSVNSLSVSEINDICQ